MNATELAFELDKSREESYTSEHLVGQAATMLRKQQAEIDYWKQAFEKAMELLTPKTKPPETHVDLVDWVKELISKEKV